MIRVSLLRRSESTVFYMQWRDPLSGRKVRRTTGTKIRRDAERMAAKLEKDLFEGKAGPSSRATWQEFRERYEAEELPGKAASTEKKATQVLDVFERTMRPQRLGDITSDVLAKYASTLREAGRTEATIASHLRTLRAALSWAVRMRMIPRVPDVPKIQRARKAGQLAKARPITSEEFERMLAAVGDVIRGHNTGKKRTPPPPDPERLPSWEFLLRGLWWSGLRLGESLHLHWTDETLLHVDFSSRHPLLRIPAELEKGHKDRLLPIAPEFARLLLDVPEHRRIGYVFNPRPLDRENGSARLSEQTVSRTITYIGKAAGVVVARSKTGRPKYASAHDLRRAFGTRWAARVMPQVLMEMMRHESIGTTMAFYVNRQAETTAGILWQAYDQARQ
ncbi:MAG: site-specific integrase [Pirellulaceae bacterium]|nr:site-specific integrase [Pirellulaceae bacterium]